MTKEQEYQKQYRLANKKKAQAYARAYYKTNKDHLLAKQKQYAVENKEAIRQYKKEYGVSKKKYRNLFRKEKKQRDVQYKLSENLRTRLYVAIKTSCEYGSAVRDLGCTLTEFKQYLESKFQPGMTWENWNRTGWHIDHIIPLSYFDLTDRKQVLKALHYTNLQPLWAVDNLIKKDKVS